MKKVLKKGFTLVELLVVIDIIGVLMGALFPAIFSANLNANTSTMAMRGRKIHQSLIQANIDRETIGLGTVWPQMSVEGGASGSGDGDIAEKTWQSTTEYFRELFDMGHYGSPDWKPYVQIDPGDLSGAGVPGMNGKTLEQKNVAWVILGNVQDELSDFVPVLVSRNLDVKQLDQNLIQFDGRDSRKVEVGTAQYSTPFGNKAWVLVRKGGASQVIKEKYSRMNVVFQNQGFDHSGLKNPPKFLEL